MRSKPGRETRTLHAARLVAVLLAALLGACEPEDPGAPDAAPGPDAWAPGPATALFELPRTGRPPSEFYALPFPTDVRHHADGTLDLDDHERPTPLLELYLGVFAAEQSGFGTNSAIFFRFSDRIDPASLPASPQASLEDDASVYLVDVDPRSPERGLRRPLRFRFSERAGQTIGAHSLSCLPFEGMPLRPRTTYAAVVTTRLRATDGSSVGRSPDLDFVLADDPSTALDVALVRAHHLHAVLRLWLDEPGGDERADVASVAVFTTQDPTSLMGRLREVTWRDAPAPVARRLSLRSSSEHFSLWEGVYDGPNFQSGEPPYLEPEDGGKILFDPATGDPILQRLESLRFSVAIPPGKIPPVGWPIVLYAHGTGGDYLSYVRDGTARRLADEGLAVMSIDQVLHGPRNPRPASVELAFFNFQNPVAARDNVRQGALDDFQLVRLALGLAIDDGEGGVHRFDPERIYFMGHSQGGLTGPPFLAYEPRVKAAILSGAGGLIFLSLLNKTEPVDIPTLLEALLRDSPLDEFNNLLALVQAFLDPSDPVNYGPLLVAHPAPGVPAKDIFQSEGLIDHYTPPPCIEALGLATGLSPVSPLVTPLDGFALGGLETLGAPVAGNLDGRTAVFLQYQAPAWSDGHFVVFDVPEAQRQSARFLGSKAYEGGAVLVVP